MNFEEFIRPENSNENRIKDPSETSETEETSETNEEEQVDNEVELNVQKAVVESLAADKAEQTEEIKKLRRENYDLKSEVYQLKEKISEMKSQLENVGDLLSKNTESRESNQVSLLDRLPEINDRFEGETRDQILEVLAEARASAEKDGKLRRAQLLEAVILANVPTGNLAKRRAALDKLFAENQYIVSGPVIEELDKQGIPYKHGEEYLLPLEIIKRNY